MTDGAGVDLGTLATAACRACAAASAYREEAAGDRARAVARALDLQEECRRLVWLFPREEVGEQAMERMGR